MKHFPRRQFLHLAAGALALPAVSRIARAQATYPTRPITLIVPAAAGGSTDVIGRVLAGSTALALPAPLNRGLSSCKSPSYGQNATSAAAGLGSNA
jgi:hypothetical protein